MLNTIMALWNHNPGENRQRLIKVFFAFLFIGVSISLLLFTLNTSAWFSVSGTPRSSTKKEEPVRMSSHNGIAVVGSTPVSGTAVGGVTPTATLSHKSTVVQPCVPTPPVVIQQQTTVTPQKAAIYYGNGNNGSENESSVQRQVQPTVVHVKKSKIRSETGSEVKVIATPIPRARETINITLPAPPIPVLATAPPKVTPVVTVVATATTVPVVGTAVSGGPNTVVIGATPNVSTVSAHSFVQNVQRKVAMRVPVQPLVKGFKKSSDRRNKLIQRNVRCGEKVTYSISSGGTVLNIKHRVGLLLGSAILGTLMLSCFMFARRRED